MDIISFRLPDDHPLGAIMQAQLSLMGEPIRRVRIMSIRRYADDGGFGEGFWVEVEPIEDEAGR